MLFKEIIPYGLDLWSSNAVMGIATPIRGGDIHYLKINNQIIKIIGEPHRLFLTANIVWDTPFC
ncbi:hypothetical protein [aff. Roholtiella sp. LEGE 12411]|uniref:hypothetical protein n=1 Tax=aff. Roholtiella sp. LEGE 12411 TaxID=1828822 RepID=UPI001881FCF1|nr:hypothetical protein [aff. Roholtiella sp. LEGE 12411]MBE9037417.1 hypothetical protein [aff. Roholtiella sp. LEGE 12411]